LERPSSARSRTSLHLTARSAPAAASSDLVLVPEGPARVVSGLVTGLHAPVASHLLLLQPVVGPQLLRAGYEAAVTRRYLWHEFEENSLFLP
jgi:S-adenosylmethionine:tRNA ribosyltransferase-isomerase